MPESDTPQGEEQETSTSEETEETEETQAETKEVDWEAEAKKHRALSKKHEKRAKANAEAAKKLKELEDGNKSEIQKAADKAAQAEKDAESAKAKALRYEVAIDKGVPKELMRFLNGTTEEELTEQADALLEAVKVNEKEEDDARTTPKEKLRAGASGKAGGDSITDYREHVQKLAKY